MLVKIDKWKIDKRKIDKPSYKESGQTSFQQPVLQYEKMCAKWVIIFLGKHVNKTYQRPRIPTLTISATMTVIQ